MKCAHSSNDLLASLHHYALEAITMITLDTRMGCLEENPDPKVKVVMESVELALKEMAAVLVSPALYMISPSLSGSFRRMGKGLDVFADYVKVCTYMVCPINNATRALKSSLLLYFHKNLT